VQLVEAELVAENSRSRCAEQDIPFFRFSPTFDEIVSSGETDVDKLINMVIQTKIYLKQQDKELEKITNIFHKVAESSQDIQGDDKQVPDLGQDRGNEDTALGDQNSLRPPFLSKVIEEEPEDQVEDPPVAEAVNNTSESFKDVIVMNQNQHKERESEQGQYTKFELFRSGSLINCIEMDLGKPLDSPKFDAHAPATRGDAVPESPCQKSLPSFRQTPEPGSQGLYQPYRADTRQLDMSKQEYTDYSRETLV